MRRKDKQVLDQNVLFDVIHKAMVCRMGLVKGDKPYVIPLSFGFDGNHIYVHCALKGEKVEILKDNNHVCIEFEQDVRVIENENPCHWSVSYLSVVVHGQAELLADPVQKNYGLAQIVSHYRGGDQEISFSETELKTVLVYKITPEEIIGKKSGI